MSEQSRRNLLLKEAKRKMLEREAVVSPALFLTVLHILFSCPFFQTGMEGKGSQRGGGGEEFTVGRRRGRVHSGEEAVKGSVGGDVVVWQRIQLGWSLVYCEGDDEFVHEEYSRIVYSYIYIFIFPNIYIS